MASVGHISRRPIIDWHVGNEKINTINGKANKYNYKLERSPSTTNEKYDKNYATNANGRISLNINNIDSFDITDPNLTSLLNFKKMRDNNQIHIGNKWNDVESVFEKKLNKCTEYIEKLVDNNNSLIYVNNEDVDSECDKGGVFNHVTKPANTESIEMNKDRINIEAKKLCNVRRELVRKQVQKENDIVELKEQVEMDKEKHSELKLKLGNDQKYIGILEGNIISMESEYDAVSSRIENDVACGFEAFTNEFGEEVLTGSEEKISELDSNKLKPRSPLARMFSRESKDVASTREAVKDVLSSIESIEKNKNINVNTVSSENLTENEKIKNILNKPINKIDDKDVNILKKILKEEVNNVHEKINNNKNLNIHGQRNYQEKLKDKIEGLYKSLELKEDIFEERKNLRVVGIN